MDTYNYDSRWSQEEGQCYKRCSSKWCNIETSRKPPGTASRSWGPYPGDTKAESYGDCKSGVAGGHRPSPDIIGRHHQDGLPAEIHVPWPVGDSGWLARDVEGRLVKPKSLWPTDAWLPAPKIPAAMFTRGDRDDPEPPGADSDTSNACTSDEEPEAEGEETPKTEPVELLEKFDTVAQGAGEPQIPIGMGAEDGDTGVEPSSDGPAAAASDSGPAEEHVVHVVVDDSDDAGDLASDPGTGAAAPAAANDMDVRRK